MKESLEVGRAAGGDVGQEDLSGVEAGAGLAGLQAETSAGNGAASDVSSRGARQAERLEAHRVADDGSDEEEEDGGGVADGKELVEESARVAARRFASERQKATRRLNRQAPR